MPKAAVHEHHDALSAKHEVRFTDQVLLSSPTCDPMPAEKGNESEFGCAVAH
jgi:hypothetical protein